MVTKYAPQLPAFGGWDVTQSREPAKIAFGGWDVTQSREPAKIAKISRIAKSSGRLGAPNAPEKARKFWVEQSGVAWRLFCDSRRARRERAQAVLDGLLVTHVPGLHSLHVCTCTVCTVCMCTVCTCTSALLRFCTMCPVCTVCTSAPRCAWCGLTCDA